MSNPRVPVALKAIDDAIAKLRYAADILALAGMDESANEVETLRLNAKHAANDVFYADRLGSVCKNTLNLATDVCVADTLPDFARCDASAQHRGALRRAVAWR